MRLALALCLAVGCSPELHRTDGHCAARSAVRRDAIEGRWWHRITSVRTLDGPYVPPRTSTEPHAIELALEGDYLVARLDGRLLMLRVADQFDVLPAESPPCDATSWSWDRPSREREWLRVDWWTDVGDLVHRIADVARAEPTPVPLWATELDLTPTVVTDDALTLPMIFAITPWGCPSTDCESLVEIVHQLDRHP